MIGEGYRMSHLWVFDLATEKARRLTSGAFTVGQFSWSPDGTQIAFDHRINSANTSGATADISVVSVADGKVRAARHAGGRRLGPGLVARRIEDRVRVRDDEGVLVPQHRDRRRSRRRRAHREHHRRLRRESVDRPTGRRPGLFFSASHRTWAFLYSIDPATKAVKKYAPVGPVDRLRASA